MTGLELQTSGVGSDHSTWCASTTAHARFFSKCEYELTNEIDLQTNWHSVAFYWRQETSLTELKLLIAIRSVIDIGKLLVLTFTAKIWCSLGDQSTIVIVHFWTCWPHSWSPWTRCRNNILAQHNNIMLEGCRHSSVDPSAPTILPPRVRIPSTPSKLLFHL